MIAVGLVMVGIVAVINKVVSDRSLPDYDIVKHERYDAPVKTQVEVRAVSYESPTRKQLENLLHRLYKDASLEGGFQYSDDGSATHVFVFVYMVGANTTGVNWLGAIRRVGRDSQVQMEINDELLLKAQMGIIEP